MTEVESVKRSTVVTTIGDEPAAAAEKQQQQHHVTSSASKSTNVVEAEHSAGATVTTKTTSDHSATTAATTENNNTSATLTPRAGSANSDVVLLHAHPRSPLMPHLSPFVLKLETWLRMNQIPYEFTDRQPMHAKTSKMPWIEYRGQNLYDSQLIIENLNARGGNVGRQLDRNLNAHDAGAARAFQKMIDEYMCWGLTVWRFSRDPECRVFSPSSMPSLGLLGGVKKFFFKRQAEQQAYAQGMSRFDDPVYQNIVKQDLKAVSDYMGTNEYLLGNEPHSVDASLFGLLAQYLYFDKSSPFTAYMNETTPNLVKFVERMKSTYFADWDELLAKASPQHAASSHHAAAAKSLSTSSQTATSPATTTQNGIVADSNNKVATSVVAESTMTKKEKTPKKAKKHQQVDNSAAAVTSVDAVAGGDASTSHHHQQHHTHGPDVDKMAIINTASPGYAEHHQHATTATNINNNKNAVTTTTTTTETAVTSKLVEVPLTSSTHVTAVHERNGEVNATNTAVSAGGTV